MAEVEYSVAAILQLSGAEQAEAKLARVGKAADHTNERLKMLASGAASGMARLGGIVGDAIDSMTRLGVGALAAGSAITGAFAFNEVKTGLVDVNAKLEQSTIGFGTIFHMLGNMDLSTGLSTAGDLISQIRDDAKDLPGEFQDFVEMAQTITSPLLNAGKGVKEIRDLTRDTVVAASSLGIRYDQASREMAMLLEGHAGGHNVLGTRLGITTSTLVNGKEFNQATAAERFDFITKRIGPAKDALGQFSASWEGLTSTLSDTRKQFLGAVTEPLFGRMKLGMVDLLHYLDAHKAQTGSLAQTIGIELANAYDRVEAKVRKLPEAMAYVRDHWAEIRGQVEGVEHTISNGVHGAIKLLGPAARVLGHELEHPSRLLKEIVALRVGAAAAGAAPGMLNAGLSAAKFFGSGASAIGGAAGAAEGAAAAAGGVAAVGAAPVLIAAGAALVGIAAIGTAVWDDAYGSAQRAKNIASEFDTTLDTLGATMSSLWTKNGLLRESLDFTGAVLTNVGEKSLGGLNVALGGARDVINWLNNDLEAFVKVGFGQSDEARVKVDLMSMAIDGLTAAIGTALPMLGQMMLLYHLFGGGQFEGVPDERISHETEATSSLGVVGSQVSSVGPEKPKVNPTPIVDARGSKFEVKIDARDQDPDRIIRRMIDKIGETAIAGTMGSAGMGVAGGAR